MNPKLSNNELFKDSFYSFLKEVIIIIAFTEYLSNGDKLYTVLYISI